MFQYVNPYIISILAEKDLPYEIERLDKWMGLF